jgi:hypothetical protein
MGTLHEDLGTFMISVSQLFLEQEMFQKKKIVEKIKTHNLSSIIFSP